MGVCALQHRIITGLFNSYGLKETGGSHCSGGSEDVISPKQVMYYFVCAAGLILYLYILCLLMALHVNTLYKNDRQYYNAESNPTERVISHGENLYICFLIVILNLGKRKCNILLSHISNFGDIIVQIFRKCNRKNNTLKILTFITLWITALNLILIVICNLTIKNPGPKPKLSVLYQNVRGIIPPSELGLPNPMLNMDKISEIQTHVMDKKPDIVILNETWLSKNINDDEIFSSQLYKVFRLDRSLKTHPMDPSNPKKYRKNGGGVLIAIRSDLNCESTLVTLKCKAEILSVELALSNGKYICLSTLYRVGTLGTENHSAVDNYLRNLAKRKKYSSVILIGDINLNQVSWPVNSNTTNRIQKEFLETFDDLNLDQLIVSPTHIGGGTLDLLLTTLDAKILVAKILVKFWMATKIFATKFFADQNFRQLKFSPTKILLPIIFPNLDCTKYPLPKTGDKLLLNFGQFKDWIHNYK